MVTLDRIAQCSDGSGNAPAMVEIMLDCHAFLLIGIFACSPAAIMDDTSLHLLGEVCVPAFKHFGARITEFL